MIGMLLLPISVRGAIVNSNVGFEDDKDFSAPIAQAPLSSWVISQFPGVNEVLGRDTTSLYALAPYEGNIAAAFASAADATGSGASIKQTLATTTGSTYKLSLWVANSIQDSGNQNNIFSVRWGGNLITLSGTFITEVSTTSTYVVTPDTNWFQIVANNLSPTGSSTTLEISARNNNWATLVDYVLVEETPEPSTVLMLGLGATMVGLRRRRQPRP